MYVSGTIATTATTDTTEVRAGATPFRFHCSGTFANGTLQLKFKDAAGTYRSLANAAYTAADDDIITLEQNTTVKATLSGATSAPSVFWQFSSTA